MKYYCTFLLICIVLFGHTAIAQDQDNEQVRIIGKVIDQKTGKAMEAATVSVQSTKNADSSSRSSITDKDGNFTIKISKSANIRLVVSAIGFEKLEEKLNIDESGAEFNAGKFLMITDVANLANVVVTAKKPAMVLAVDRRIFSADAVITSKGGNAVDLMKNIPSLSVDINGGVQLRNSTPQILVDGRPTILTLEQIPADDIDKVEVITNPSSKYDASSTGGIINIIMKKNRKAGLNGIASIGVGSPQVLNGNLSLNYRKGKFNYFVSANYNQSGGIAKGEAYRQNKSEGKVTDFFNQHNETERDRKFKSVRFGADYFINKLNSVSITQSFVKGKFNNSEIQQQQYFDKDQTLTNSGTRLGTDDFYFTRSNTQLNYRCTYDKTGKEWTADLTINAGKNGGNGTILNQLFLPDGQPDGAANFVLNESDGLGRQFTFQTDYVNPLSEKSKLEFGARSFHNLSKDKYDVYSAAPSGNIKLPLSNNYNYTEMVNAVYTNYSNSIGKFKYQGGIRIEQSTFKGELVDSSKKFGYDFPSGGNDLWNTFFPSLFLTYELATGNDLQVNFSRRINRPNFWQINPYVDISDPMNIRKGNPSLQPEFTNSFELNYNRQYSTGNFLVSLFYRNNTEDITMYSDTISQKELENLNNAAISPNAILTTYINADRTNRSGVEITWQQRFGKNFDMTPSFSSTYRDLKAEVNGVNLSNTGFNWEAKLIANYKILAPDKILVKNTSFQLSAQYESPRVLPQGKQKEQYGIDFAIRRDFLKNKAGTLTFNINDVLNSRRFGSVIDTENFYQDSYRRWNVRTFRLTFSYRFGKNDFELFKRKSGGEEEQG